MNISGISVVIPVYNNSLGLNKCVDSLLNGSDIPDEIIVVDDGSTEPLELTRRSYVNLICIPNGGPANARNVGASEAKFPYVFFIDSDCWVGKDTIERLRKWITDSAEVGIAGPYGLTKDGEVISTYFDVDLNSRYRNIESNKVWVHGTYNLTVDREKFLSLGGFDLNFPRPSGEDFDLVLRMSDKYGPFDYDPDLNVFSSHEQSYKKYLKKQFYRGFDRVYYYIKNKKKLHRPDYYTIREDFVDILIFPILFAALWNRLFLVYFIFNIYAFVVKVQRFDCYPMRFLSLCKIYILNCARFMMLGLGLFVGLAARVFK